MFGRASAGCAAAVALAACSSSSSPKNMMTVTEQNLTATMPEDFARNSGEIMVEAGNPSHIKSVADLANSSLMVVTIKGAPKATAAAAFISYVLGPNGQQVLESFGFLAPTS